MKKALIFLLGILTVTPVFAQDAVNETNLQNTFSVFMFSFQALGIIAIVVTVVFFIFYYLSKIRTKKGDNYEGEYYERRV